MPTLSVVVNTLNEEKNLPHCLKSVKNIADEIIVVDMHSTDKTREIAKKFGAKVFLHESMGYVEPARNFAISKASSYWILILDADESLPSTLASKIQKVIKNNSSADYYAIPRKNIIFGRWMKHSRWWPDYNIRLFKKGKVSWDEHIHSIPKTQGEGKDLPHKEKYAISHQNYTSIEQFINRMNRYTTIQANMLKSENYVFHWTDLIKKPSSEFFSRYFSGQGYKDGFHGLALSSLQALSELVLYLKVWQLNKFEEKNINVKNVILQIKTSQKEMNYWTADTLVKESGSFIQRVKRKFKLQ